MKKVFFVTQVGTSFFGYYFIGGGMRLFNDGLALDVEDTRGINVIARLNGFTEVALQQAKERWTV